MFTNTSQQLAEKKLLLLYILNKIEKPLTNAEITQFILENDIMNYFMLQQFFLELLETKFINEEDRGDAQYFSIAEKGKNTLNYFINRISNSTKKDIDKLILEKKFSSKEIIEVKADYIRIKEDVYKINLIIMKDAVNIVDLKFNANNLQRAQEICEKWEKDAMGIYKNIINLF